MKASGYSPSEGGSQHSPQSGNRSPFRKRVVWKKLAAGAVAFATAFGGMGLVSSTASASTDRDSYTDTVENSTFETAREKYGLTKHMKNGAILHAWMWSFKNITANMEAIAKAGYTSVQTEPMSKIKYVPANGKKFDENWYYVYQPSNTSIGNFVVGTEDDLKEMTDTAHKYGVRVIVDVVANHFTSDWSAIDSDWQNKDYFHSRSNCGGANGDNINYSSRRDVTQCHLLGLWDLNTQNQTVADRMQSFLKTAVADGVDGFRFDAAKHVELPTEKFDNKTSNYWNTILQNGAQFQYGEVLQGDSGLDYKAYANLFKDNSSDGGGNTASNYGGTIRAAIQSENLTTKMVQNIDTGGANEDQLVTWVESHDNYANKEQTGSDGVKKGVSTELTDYQIMMGWAIVGSRKAGAPLYFNRPKESGGRDQNGNLRAQFAEKSQLGDTGDDMWKNKSVVAVNHFRNAMDGKSEHLQNCSADSNSDGAKKCVMIERYTKDGVQNDGVVIANMAGEQNLAGLASSLDDGTYTDEVNGGKLVVQSGKIVSGTAKGGSVSVFYAKGQAEPSVYADSASAEFSSESAKVTLHAQYADNLKYTTTEGKSGSFKDGESISVGSTLAENETVTVKVTGTATKDGTKVKKGDQLSGSVTLKKVPIQDQHLASQYGTNKVGNGVKKTINFTAGKGASLSDWDSSMLIAQGAANDDPRVYRSNSMYEVPIDLYALYGAYDDDNLYLMWEMTNVQDVVDRGDDYPLSQGHLWQTQNLPFHIAIDTKDDSTRVGNNGGLKTGGSLWASNITWGGKQNVNKVVTISTNGSNGPWVYQGDSDGLDSNAEYGPAANAKTNTKKSGIKFGYGNGILSDKVIGIDGGWGDSNGRVVGDMTAENESKTKWVNFNDKGHDSAGMDDHYEIAIPLDELGTTADHIAANGIGIELAATFGLSAMDSLPYDLAMNDNADLPDTTSQVNNSFEKSDEDMFTVQMANIGGTGSLVETKSVKIDQSSYTTDISNGVTTKQLTATTDPEGASVSWRSSNKDVATVSSKGVVTPVKAGTAKITAKAGKATASITVTVTGEIPPTPVKKNTIYATKPSGWGKMYAYVYTGDGASAVNNAAWPGVEMTAADNCDQTGYKYEVPDSLASNAKVIFNDGGSQQFPGSREPGLDYNGGTVRWDGSSSSLASVTCTTNVPVTSVAITGAGVSSGKLSVRKGASAQLAATVSPGNATDRAVSWKSGDTAVATVDKAGKVTGVKAGKATITATAGGKSASVEVTVEEPQTTVQITFRAAADLKAGETLYAVGDWGQGKGKIWNRAGGVRLAGADGSYTGTTTVAKGHSVTARLVKVTADGKTEWNKIGDVKATADSSKTVSLKWDENAGKTVGITINAAADLKAGETLYAVGDWGQGKGKIWNRAGGVRLAQSGSIYTGTAKVDRNHAMTFRLIKVDASGRNTWDPTTDRKTTADKTKSIGVTWSINKVNEDGSIPDGNEFYITGKGVENGKLTMQAHHLAELNLVGASTSDKVTWWSDSAAVAVSGTGTVYAVQKGAAKVSAKVGTKIASVDVTVEDNSVNKVSSVTIAGDGVSNGKLSIVAGKNIQLNATVLPENATNKTVSWTSSNSSVVNVMGTGVLTTAKAGTATITATADGVSAKVAVTVTAAPNPFNDDIVIAGAESGKVIGSEQFQLTAREKDGSSFANVEWSIPDTNLLMFINKGFSKTTTGRTVGLKAQYDLSRHDYVDTVISVKATRTDGTVLTAQKKISVGGSDSVSDSDPLDSLTPSADGLTKTGDNEYTITIPAGSSKHVSVTALPSNARQLPLWKELGGDDTVATVDADGTIYAHKAGTFATSANNYNRYFQLTVVVE